MRVGDTVEPLPTEAVLGDDSPVHYGFAYIADNVVVTSDVQGTVGDLKRRLLRRGKSVATVRRYDFGRGWGTR